MGSCVYGASVKSGLDPNTEIAVSRDLWESVTGAPTSWLDWFFDMWMPSFIKASDLCALNLSDPALPSVSDIVAGYGAAFLPGGTMYAYVQQKLEYVAFANACTCNGPAPGTWVTLCDNTVTMSSSTWTDNAFPCGVTPGETYRILWDSLDKVGSPNGEHYYDFRNASNGLNGPCYPTYPAFESYGVGYEWDDGEHVAPANSTTLKLKYRNYNNTGYLTRRVRVQHLDTSGPVAPTAPAVPSQPPTLQLPGVPTCGTEQDVCNRLSQLQQQVQSVMAMVTLIQRQKVPFAYLQQPPQAISGSGVVAVQGILGLALALSDSRSGVGNYPDNPTTFFDLGWLSFCTADGCQDARQIRRHNDLVLDVNPSTTSVRYSLPSGVSGTLIPLVREP